MSTLLAPMTSSFCVKLKSAAGDKRPDLVLNALSESFHMRLERVFLLLAEC